VRGTPISAHGDASFAVLLETAVMLRIADLTAPIVAIASLPGLTRRPLPVSAKAIVVFGIGDASPAVIAPVARFV
jgi:hypothetical protein